MNATGNTILITRGGSGIGHRLAEAFYQAGNQVIITGRGQSALDETAQAHPGMRAMLLDMNKPDEIQRVVAQIKAEIPKLNVLINNAGIMKPENLKAGIEDLLPPTIHRARRQIRQNLRSAQRPGHAGRCRRQRITRTAQEGRTYLSCETLLTQFLRYS